MDKITEKSASKLNGFVALFVVIGLFALTVYLVSVGIRNEDPTIIWFLIPLVFISFLSFGGFMIVQPNESKVLMLFGKYTGTVSYTHLRAHETVLDLVCRLLLENKKDYTP